MRLDEKTGVPLSWMGACMLLAITATSAGTFWVFSVNDRLGRIEDKLGIKPYVAASLISTASAGQK